MIKVVAWHQLPYATRLLRPLHTAAGTWRVRRGVFLAAEDEAGRLAWGEYAPLGELAPLEPRPLGFKTMDDVRAWLPADPAVASAYEQPLLTLLAEREGVRLAELFGTPAPRVQLNALLTAVEPRELAAEARARLVEGFRTLKIKSPGPFEADLARLAAVREAVGPAVQLRLDPNAGWPEAEMEARLAAVAAYDPEYTEQPSPTLAPTRYPIAADESAHRPGGLEACLGLPVIVLKHAIFGGLMATWDAMQRASAAGTDVVLTSVLDRGVSTAAGLHLAAAGTTRASGLATSDLFEGPPAVEGLTPINGAVTLPAGPGLGFKLNTELLRCS